MSASSGNTTVTGAGSPRRAGAPADLSLVWVFPRPNEPPIALSGKGDAERVIGRDEGSAIRLTGNDISRRHAVLRKSGSDAGVVIVDLGSRNGVRVNGCAVETAPLTSGDVVRVGGWVGVVTHAPGDFKEIAPGLFGGSYLQSAIAPLAKAAPSDLPIVIEGETGTGKEIVARCIHLWSARQGPLVAVNCAALPEALAEGELFGYRRGAFTGADRASPGFFRSAESGTLLLDEVSDLPMSLQGKLLRVLEEEEVQPLGETRPVPIDVRIVVAGQKPLAEAVREGRFRPDLLARLDGITIHLPPLRRRREDVLPLFSHLLKDLGKGRVPAVESDLVERLCLHDWPFNVRELVLLARRLLVLHGGESTLSAHHLPDRIGHDAATPNGSDIAAARAVSVSSKPVLAGAKPVSAAPEPVELPAFMAALRTSGGNVAQASAMLGITRQRAYRLMEGQSVDLEALRKQDEAGS